MRSSSLFSAAAAVLASTVAAGPISQSDCLLHNAEDLASFSNCGHQGTLHECLSRLESFAFRAIQTCYIHAGCSPYEAKMETESTIHRCGEISQHGNSGADNAGSELRRRFRAALEPHVPPVTQAPPALPARSALAAMNPAHLFARSARTGFEQCYTTSTITSNACDVTTEGNRQSTRSCFDTQVPRSACSPGWTCSLAADGNPVCMDLEHMNTSGIVVAIVFAVALTLALGTLTFLCVKDKRDQKRMAAKAEATALARAATKKKKADEARAQRAPLIQRHQPESQDVAANPFDDGSHHP